MGFLAKLLPNFAAARDAAARDAALAALFEAGTAGIAEVDLRTGKFVRVNRRFCEIMHRDAALLLTLGPGDVIHPEDRDAVKAEWIGAMKAEGRWESEVRHLRPDGLPFWALLGVSVWRRDAAGAPERCIAVLQDVTESHRMRDKLRQSEELLRLGQKAGRIGTFGREVATGKMSFGPELCEILGLPPNEVSFAFEEFLDLILAEDRVRVAEAIAQSLRTREPEVVFGYRIHRRNDGQLRHLESRGRYFYDAAGEPLRSVGVVIDLTERKEAEQRLEHAASHDALTGLGNRSFFAERLELACARALAGHSFAVLCLDLDRFKDVNDTLGHPVGDRLLVEVGARLRQQLRAGDSLARLGGDEFAIVQTGMREADDAGRLANRLVEKLRQPFLLDGHRVIIGASIGVAVARHDDARAEDLLKAADLALYEAKGQPQRGWRFYAPTMNAQAKARFELDEEIRRALALGEFELFYQPVIVIDTRCVSRFEALIRWRHPQRGLVPPDSFIPACEQNGLICEIGEWVLRRACVDAMGWPKDVGVSVNISAVQVSDGALDVAVATALARSGLAPERLELEITETALLQDSAATLATLAELKAIGVKIAIDDFGSGHASIGYLRCFPFDKVKIDRTFAREVDVSPKNAAVVKAMLDICAAFDLPTVIEGVETQAQLQTLIDMGATRVQGYLFSRPRPLAEVPGLIARFSPPPRLVEAAE